MRVAAVICLLCACGPAVVRSEGTTPAKAKGDSGAGAPDARGAPHESDAGPPHSTGQDGATPVAPGRDAMVPAVRDAGMAGPAVPDAAPPVAPNSSAGSYQVTAKDLDVTAPADVRKTEVIYTSAGWWVASYNNIPAPVGKHRAELRAVRFSDANQKQLGAPLITSVLPGNAYALEPTIAVANDVVLSVWEDDRVSNGAGGFREIFAQLVRVEGTGTLSLMGPNFNISNLPSLEEFSPCAAFEPSTGFLVAWSDMRESGMRADPRVLFARPVSLGGAVGAEMRLGDTANWQVNCTMRAGGGRILVAWSDYVPVSGKVLESRYRARFVVAGQPQALLTVASVGNIPPDPPAIAHNAHDDEWLVVYAAKLGGQREIRATILRKDGTARRQDLLVGTHTEGAAAPFVAYSRLTHSYLLTFHSMTTTDAFRQELDPDGNRVGAALSVNNAPPKLGTFYTPVAASTASAQFLIIMMHNYSRIAATLMSSSRSLLREGL